MADKTMHHVVIGSNTYEIVDEQGRAEAATNTQDITALKEDYDDIDDRVTALEGGGSGSGLTEGIKAALLQIASKVAYIDEHGQNYYDALYDALYPPADLVSISAVYTQSGTVYDTDTLDSLKDDLVVTAHYSDQTTETVTIYTLSGTLTEGTSTITVSYGGKTTTFNVTVIDMLYPLLNGEWTTSNGEYKLTITEGRHCKAEVIRAGSSPTTHFVALNCNTGAYSISTADSVNNLPAIFTLPANKLVTLKMKNLVNDNNGGSERMEFQMFLRDANGTTSFLSTGQQKHTSDVTVTATSADDTGIGAVGFGVNGLKYKQYAYCEFDVELTVGDDVYIGGA